MDIQPERIRQRLALANGEVSRDCPPLPDLEGGPIQPAAVLIPLLQDGSTWKLLFIKRTHQHHDRHSGQIAFPGGRAEPGDQGLLGTALRETREEIGLDPTEIQVLGRSCPITTVTDYAVSPFVGILPWPSRLQLSQEEVEKTLLIPLDWLNAPENHQTRPWRSAARPGRELPVIFFNSFQGEILWGATARIVLDFLELIQDRP